MTIPHNVRASDRTDLLFSQREDFVDRRRDITLKKIFNGCLALLIIVLGVAILVYNNTPLGAMMCVIVGSVTLSLGKQIEKQQKLLYATEFMNALFASIASAGYTFCMIARKDGEIMYLNRGLQELFPDFLEQPVRNIDVMLNIHKVSDENRVKINSMIAQGVDDRIAFTINDGNKKPRSIVMSVEPIERPGGFVLLRGKE